MADIILGSQAESVGACSGTMVHLLHAAVYEYTYAFLQHFLAPKYRLMMCPHSSGLDWNQEYRVPSACGVLLLLPRAAGPAESYATWSSRYLRHMSTPRRAPHSTKAVELR